MSSNNSRHPPPPTCQGGGSLSRPESTCPPLSPDLPLADDSPLTYQIRESQRARRLSLRVLPSGEIEVVVPRGYDRRRIPDLMRDRRTWLERAVAGFAQRRQHQAQWPADQLILLAVGETWTIDRQPSPPDPSRSGYEVCLAQQRLIVRSNDRLTTPLIQRWLGDRAMAFLLPRLQHQSDRLGIDYCRAVVRGQKTRWGSCSARGTISLNWKLLFLPLDLVDHVLVHELCHRRQPNHSPAFWQLVAHFDPEWRSHRAAMKTSIDSIPAWLN